MSSNRRQPNRSARTTTSYARPFSWLRNPAVADHNVSAPAAVGFFPAITHFTDSITALPREVQRHFTTLKETEGKAYQPDQAITDLINQISTLPEPSHLQAQAQPQAFLGFSIANSIVPSANASSIDGHVPRSSLHKDNASDDIAMSEAPVPDEHLLERQNLFLTLQSKLREMTVVLDEKNMVLSAANDTLSRQLARLDSAMPHIQSEVSEEARLGSNTHWALAHMKELRRINGPHPVERSRREIQTVNNLIAAGAAVHESDIAHNRSEARREAMLARRSKVQNADSDFDERPISKRPYISNKARRPQDTLNDAPIQKRRRVDKTSSNNADRSLTSAVNSRPVNGRASPRESSVAEPQRRRPKVVTSHGTSSKKITAGTPPMAASPTRAIFATSTARAYSPVPSSQRAPLASVRRDSTNNRPSSSASNSKSHVVPAAAMVNGKGPTSSMSRSILDTRQPTKVHGETRPENPLGINGLSNSQRANHASSIASTLKREDTEPVEKDALPNKELSHASVSAARSAPSHHRNGSKSSKPSPPVDASTAHVGGEVMSRSRSTRGTNNNFHNPVPSSPVAIPPSPRRSHKKNVASAESPSRSRASSMEPNNRRPNRPIAADEVVESGDAEVGADDEVYCICGDVSYGDMIACDNAKCPYEWFHLHCVGMSRPPSTKSKWYCPSCKTS